MPFTRPERTDPTISDFSNAPHDHKDAAGGGDAYAGLDRESFVSAVHQLLSRFGNGIRLFWVPKSTDTASTISEDADARTFTYDASKAGDISEQGGAYVVDFDGSADEADVPDADDLSFGDFINDYPFSIVALVSPDVVNTEEVILSKYDSGATTREWRFFLDANGYLNVELYDESADTYLGVEKQSALTAATWALVGMTYNGSKGYGGLALFKDGALLSGLTNTSSGTYVAMENTAEEVSLACQRNSAALASGFNGKLGFVLLVAGQLSADDMLALKNMSNAYFGVTL